MPFAGVCCLECACTACGFNISSQLMLAAFDFTSKTLFLSITLVFSLFLFIALIVFCPPLLTSLLVSSCVSEGSKGVVRGVRLAWPTPGLATNDEASY